MSVLGGSAGSAAGLLLVIAGIWLLLQTIVGGLPGRISALGSGKSSSSSSSAGSSSAKPNPVGKGVGAVAKAAGAPPVVANGLSGVVGDILRGLGKITPIYPYSLP